jgi:hypothetical protein
MRHSLVALAAFALLALSLVAASAQGGGGRRGGGFGRNAGGLALLRMESVQKELKMTPDQIAKVDTKQQELRQQMRELRQNGGDDPRAAMEKMQELNHKAVAEILDETQQKRFHQLELQREGPAALAHKEVQDKLGLSEDQRSKIADIQRKAGEDMRSMMEGKNLREMSDDERRTMMEKMRSMQKETGEKMLAVLTDDQRSKWTDMQGAKFEFGRPERGNGA